MQVLTSHTIPTESKMVAGLVKKYIRLVDANASVIFFGSHVRGDAANDSDWDFLVLTQKTSAGLLENELRKILGREVELK